MKNKRSRKASRGPIPRKAAVPGLLALLLLACGGADRPPPSIVLVVADTLRADRLGHAGHPRARTPAFDALEGQSVSFVQARSTSSWTLPSTASLFLSQRVSQHGAAGWHARLPGDRTNLARELAAAGYRTALWTANRVIAGGRGFARDFDHFELVTHPDHAAGVPLDERAFGPGPLLTRRALAWIGEQQRARPDQPFLATLHYMEPHAPYLCGPGANRRCRRRALGINRRLLAMDWDLPPAQRRQLSELYDADVVRMDAVLAELVRGLADRGLLDRVWLVVTADHGELLGEDGLYMHGRSLADPLVRVPLFFRGPGAAPRRVETPVSLMDVAPTLLELAGAPAPGSFRGRSLRPALEGGDLPARPVVSELFREGETLDPRQRHVLAIVADGQKYLVRTDGGVERYDLAADPTERSPLPADPGAFAALTEDLGLSPDPERYLGAPSAAPTPETLEALRNLGYLREPAPEGAAP